MVYWSQENKTHDVGGQRNHGMSTKNSRGAKQARREHNDQRKKWGATHINRMTSWIKKLYTDKQGKEKVTY